jgi:hypothetical protein
MKNYQSYIPPHGTTVIRTMSGAERRHAGRLAYAREAERELRCMTSLPYGTPVVSACSNGYRVILKFGKVSVLAQFRNASRMGYTYTFMDMIFPYEAEHSGTNTFTKWLSDQDPTFTARLLKNAHKQLRDHRSYEGTRLALAQRGQRTSSTQNIEPFSSSL